ncbi:MAG: multicopper oxidase domain-containing protein [Flavipsychrobacter sp.]|nr:multicopper oxidase domain-containing protein [Flavipsychrobacter sp.]
MIVGRNSSSLTLSDGSQVRTFGFAAKLNELPGLPGTTIEAREGDSLEIDFWNVSQGNPHDIWIQGIQLQKRNEPHEIYTDDNIHHMEHGYYSFTANHAGTYIYYCPVNYPLDVQAGMFGILIVRPKLEYEIYHKHISKELLWCGFEMDTAWHTDSILDAEQEQISKMVEQLKYHPQYFFINDKRNGQLTSPARFSAKVGETVLIRLGNTGLMQHVVTFPKEMKLTVLTKNAVPLSAHDAVNTLILKPLDAYEILVSSDNVLNGFVSYAFKNEGQDTPIQIQKIPVLITQ